MKKSEKQNVISFEQAQKEVDKFLDFHGVDTEDADNQKPIKLLINRVCDGSLVVNDDATLEYTLKYPLQQNGELKVLKFNNRCERSVIIPLVKDLGAKDLDHRMNAYTAGLTGINKQILLKMHNYDQKLCDAIVGFIVG